MQCAACRASVPDGRFCLACGAPQTDAAYVAAVAGVSMQPTLAVGSSGSGSDEGRFPVGTILSERYRILGFLGRGGMGEVYRAFDLKLDQIVALKFLPTATTDNARLLDRFRGEVRLGRQVSHRSVCRVHDIGDADGAPFISMEYIEGDTLANLLKQIGRLPGDKALELSRRLCAGLAAAHERGVLHRDLKPGNIMIDRQGQVRIMDFGLAAAADAVVGGDLRSGTPAYMAPEQKEGREVTVRSDVYSLGLVFAEMFTGRRASHDMKLSGIVSDLDPAVERTIQRCLDPDPKNRPASAIDVARMLPGGDPLAEALAAGETPSPEMVAASNDTGVLSVLATVACLLFVVIGIVPALLLASRVNLLDGIPLPDAPQVLASKARDVAGRLGYPDRPVDSAYGFTEYRFKFWAEDHINPAAYRALVRRGRPPGIMFWYRQSPEPLLPIASSGNVTLLSPLPAVPRMVTVGLDPEGRLVYFDGVPPEENGPARLVDWKPLFEAAGLDPARWTSATPDWNPLMRFDEQAAWTGRYEDAPDLAMRIDAAAWKGRPVYFEVRGPWAAVRATNIPAEAVQDNRTLALRLAAVVLISIAVFVSAIFLAWRNFRRVRSDTRGAARVAAFMFGLSTFAWLCEAHHPPRLQVIAQLLSASLDLPFLAAAVPWILYMALEPYVRRRWPQSLISWTRLWSGSVRDPVVAGHVLVGLAWGIGIKLIYAAGALATEASGGWAEAPPVGGLAGPIRALGVWADGITLNVTGVLGLFFLFFLLRVFLRRTSLAVAVLMLFVAIPVGIVRTTGLGSSIPWLTVATVAVLTGVTVLLLVRFGVLTVIVSLSLSETILTQSAFGTDPSAWYAATMYLGAAIVIALAAWSFRHALGGRTVWTGALLDS